MEPANTRPLVWIGDDRPRPGWSGAGQRASRMWLLLVAMLLPGPGHAEDAPGPDTNAAMPRCGPAMDGQVYCKFGVLYECQFFDPNSMERRTGWRWKADLLRACAAPAAPRHNEQPVVVPPGVFCGPERSGHGDGSNGRTNPATAGQAGGAQQEGTMRIRPEGCVWPSRPSDGAAER
jgi:hypothetical protein